MDVFEQFEFRTTTPFLGRSENRGSKNFAGTKDDDEKGSKHSSPFCFFSFFFFDDGRSNLKWKVFHRTRRDKDNRCIAPFPRLVHPRRLVSPTIFQATPFIRAMHRSSTQRASLRATTRRGLARSFPIIKTSSKTFRFLFFSLSLSLSLERYFSSRVESRSKVRTWVYISSR